MLLVDKGRALRVMAGATPEQRAAPYEAEGLRMTFDPSQGLFEVAVDRLFGPHCDCIAVRRSHIEVGALSDRW